MGRQARSHWYALYTSVQAQLDSYEGKDSINLLIRTLADEQGYDAKVVSRMLKAGNFLKRVAGPLTIEQVSCGYAHIEQLERLHQLNREVAVSLVQSTLANQQTLLDLRNITERYAENVGTPTTTARGRARSRVAEHERRCGEALEISGPGFFGYPDGELIKVVRSDLFSHFFMIQVNGRPRLPSLYGWEILRAKRRGQLQICSSRQVSLEFTLKKCGTSFRMGHRLPMNWRSMAIV